MIVMVIAICSVTLPNNPGENINIKSSAIVPLMKRIEGTPNSKALMKLEQVCGKYCEDKCAASEVLERRRRAIGNKLLSLTSEVTEIYLRSF